MATTVGIFFDGVSGTLTYYKDNVCLGVAFTGLQEVEVNPPNNFDKNIFLF